MRINSKQKGQGEVNHHRESDKFRTPSSIELEPGELVVLLVRQHWFVFRNALLLGFFVPFVLIWVVLMLNQLGYDEGIYAVVSRILLYGSGTFFVFGIILFLWRYFLWSRTYYLVTSQRIILVTRYGLFHHDDRETVLHMVQDVKAEVNGMEPMMYGFGDVVVQVSSQDARLVMEKVPKPREVQKVIIREAHLSK